MGFSIFISLKTTDELKSITIKEMSVDDSLIKSNNLNLKDTKYITSKNCEYIIIEEMYINSLKNTYIKKSIITKDSVEYKINLLEDNYLFYEKTINFIFS